MHVFCGFFAVSIIHSVNCLTCLFCTGIQSPRHCNNVIECSHGEVCNVHQTTNTYGDVVFDVGCAHRSACSNRTQGTHTCDDCCSTDLCNAAGCGMLGYPSMRGPVCYNCPSQITEGTCHIIDVCGGNEVCMINEKREFGDKVYTSGCVGLTHCERHTMDISQIIGRSLAETVCHNCCHDDLCNAHCVTELPSVEIDLCASSPCDYGTCINGKTHYTCVCDTSHTGLNCSDIEYCRPDPCGSGRCISTKTGYKCVCDQYYTGVNCSEVEYCRPDPCDYGTCISIKTGYKCVCDQYYTGVNCSVTIPHGKDCLDLRNFTHSSGVYSVHLQGLNETIEVYCDMITDGGGWTVFQHRLNGNVSFYENFLTYENGFGDVHGDFWLGLKYIHAMTSRDKTTLRIDLGLFNGSTTYEVFTNFMLSPGPDYTLHVDHGVGTAGDEKGLSYNNGAKFSTYDKDNSHHCSQTEKGSWWYVNCGYVNLNGINLGQGSSEGIVYYYDVNGYKPLKETKMMFRRG